MLKLTILATLFFFTLPLFGEQLTATFAGVGFVGDAASVSQQYPLSSKVLGFGNNQTEYEKQLREALNKVHSPHLSINLIGTDGNYEQLSLRSGSQTVFCLSIDGEYYSIQSIRDYYLVSILVTAQILFFDFEERNIIGAFPIAREHSEVVNELPNQAWRESRISSMLTDLSDSNSIGFQFLQRLGSVQPRQRYAARIGIGSVTLSEQAIENLPSNQREQFKVWENAFAQSFAKFLSVNQNLPVIPYVGRTDGAPGSVTDAGSTIGGRMTAAFSDGRVYALKLPVADFQFDIHVRGFKKVLFSESAGGESWVFGSYINLSFKEPFSGKVFLSENLKNGKTDIIPRSQVTNEIDDWRQYLESTMVLFDQLTRQFSKPDRAWFRANGSGKPSEKAFSNAKSYLDKCR